MGCKVCGSDRILTGPFYSQNDEVCMDCGHREELAEVNFVPSDSEFQKERAQQKMSEAAEVLAEELTVEIMSDPAKMEAYLKRLKAAQEVLGDASATDTPEKTKKSRRKKSPAPTGQGEVESKAEFGIEPELIWQAIHVYQRKGSTWNETLSNARSEKEYRNENVLFFAHEHCFGEACADSCRQV